MSYFRESVFDWLPSPSCSAAKRRCRAFGKTHSPLKQSATMVKETKTRNTKRSPDVVARDYTINLHKRLHGWYPFFPTSFMSCM